jgi:hypothetical protein
VLLMLVVGVMFVFEPEHMALFEAEALGSGVTEA